MMCRRDRREANWRRINWIIHRKPMDGNVFCSPAVMRLLCGSRAYPITCSRKDEQTANPSMSDGRFGSRRSFTVKVCDLLCAVAEKRRHREESSAIQVERDLLASSRCR